MSGSSISAWDAYRACSLGSGVVSLAVGRKLRLNGLVIRRLRDSICVREDVFQ